MYIVNGDKKIKVYVLNNIFKRFMGFMFKKDFDYALCFPRCSSIHTFFMRKNIDVYLTDKNNVILYRYLNFKRNRIILPKKGVDKVFELPVDKTNLSIGEKIKIED